MREIKFRSWHKQKQVLGKPLDFLTKDGSVRLMNSVFDELDNEDGDIENIILMQYTGLKDKHGREIYEGDVVKELDGYLRSYNVMFGDHRYFLWDDYWKTRDFKDASQMEVIGNIYENPELLERKEARG